MKFGAFILPTGALILAILLSLGNGAVSIPLWDVMTWRLQPELQGVLFSIRLPRVILACVVGAALSVAGASLQGLFRNPLADPALIGVSSGAALAVGITIVVFPPLSGIWGAFSLSSAAFLGGLMTTLLILRFAGSGGTFSVIVMLLAGIAFNALAGAGMGFLQFISDDSQLRALSFWSMGGLGGALWPSVLVAAAVALPACAMLLRRAHELNVLSLGEEEARHLGLESAKVQRSVILWAALAVGAAVSVSGIIGFVGLVVPHFVRLLIGPDHRTLIPFSAISGAALLAVGDTLARTVMIPAELPVGILTSLIGGPCFLWFLSYEFSRLQEVR